MYLMKSLIAIIILCLSCHSVSAQFIFDCGVGVSRTSFFNSSITDNMRFGGTESLNLGLQLNARMSEPSKHYFYQLELSYDIISEGLKSNQMDFSRRLNLVNLSLLWAKGFKLSRMGGIIWVQGYQEWD